LYLMKMKRKTLLALILILSLLSGSFAHPLAVANAAPSTPSLAAVIYDDALASGWDSWPWGATLDFAATSPVHGGSHSISVTLNAWGALSLHSASIDTTGLTFLRFYIHGGGAGNQELNLWFDLDVNGQDVAGPNYMVPLPPANAWEEVLAPLALLNPTNATITRINWQSAANTTQPKFYIDDISFMTPTSPDAPVLTNGSLTPRAVLADGVSTLVVKVKVTDPQGAADVGSVTLDATALGGGLMPLLDDGAHNDGQAGDGVYGVALVVAPSVSPGEQKLGVAATDKAGHQTLLQLGTLVVLGTAGGTAPTVLPQHFGWGSNAWAETNDWQVASGVPWNYDYQYITSGWETWGSNFVSRFVNHAWDNHFIPMVTVYMILGTVADNQENSVHYAARLQNAASVQAYCASLLRAAQQSKGTKPVFFVIEPDFYGYMQQLSNDAANRPAGVRANDPTSYPVALNVAGYPNNLAGFGRYIVDLIHNTAPNALVAPEASMWATNGDPNSVTAAEAIQMGVSTANFIDAMGGDKADALIVEWSDRDAGSGLRPFWDDTDLSLPRPTRAILWENALSRQAGKRLLLWQIPVGNMNLDNTCDHYQDNRAAYAFSHTRDLFDAGVIGLVFGGGASCMTSVQTDGGFVAGQGAIAYAAPAAPTGLTAGIVIDSVVTLRWNENSEPDLWEYQIVLHPTSGGASTVINAHRCNSLTVLLPGAGSWTVQIQTYDAMGNLSALSDRVTTASLNGPLTVFVPMVNR
jgi:hypothetical protein